VRSLILAATHCGGDLTVRAKATVPKDRPYLQVYSRSFADAHPEHVRADLHAGTPQARHAQRRQRQAVQGFDTCDRLARIDAPTLILHGTVDRVIDPENARILAERIPHAELVMLEGAGHVYHSEQPEAADRTVLDFVRRHAPE
jgi:pimeloyl-ACP methyl ester carboxylesterase